MIAAPDLLVVGGLAVDRLADGSLVAGGSVLHAARAAAAAGRRIATITVAGPEPEAAAAVAELAEMGPGLVWPASGSIRYAIRDSGGRRRLVLEAVGAALPVREAEVDAMRPRAVLLAPVAGELSRDAVTACRVVPVRVAALQGWLRSLVPGEVVRALPLVGLAADLPAALGDLDALVASEEDLAAVAEGPIAQLDVLRRHFGTRPLLVITVGAGGAWLDDASLGRRHLPAGRRLEGISTIGAGDAFAALLAVELGAGLERASAVAAAISSTTDLLAARPA